MSQNNQENKNKGGRPKKTGTITSITEHGIKVNIVRRKDSPYFWCRMFIDGKKREYSTGTTSVDEAVAFAKGLAFNTKNEIADGYAGELKARIVQGYKPTFGDCFKVFEEVELPRIKKERSPGYYSTRWSEYQAVKACTDQKMKVHDWTKKEQDDFVRKAKKGGFETVGPKGNSIVRGEVSNTKINGFLNVLGRVVNVAFEHTHVEGRYFMDFNPVLRLKEKGMWPEKEAATAPVMNDDRLARMLAFADAYENGNNKWMAHMPKGMIKTWYLAERFTGRRRGTWRGVQIRDVLFTKEEVRQALLSHTNPTFPEEWADVWVYGAIAFVPFREVLDRDGSVKEIVGDKKRRGFIVPMSPRLRDLLWNFIHGNEELGIKPHPQKDIPNAPLFPSYEDKMKPVSKSMLYRWFKALERKAGLPEMKRGGDHPFRRQFRSERAGLFDNKLVGLVAGWASGSMEAMNQNYLQYGASAILKCVCFDPHRDLEGTGKEAGVNIDMSRFTEDSNNVLIAAANGEAQPATPIQPEIAKEDLEALKEIRALKESGVWDEMMAVLRRSQMKAVNE